MTSYLFHGGRFLDPRKDELQDGISVLIEDGTVKEVSDRPITSTSATRIDLRGRTLMPGLIDCHIHVVLTEVNLRLLADVPLTLLAAKGSVAMRAMLHRGFTTLRDTGGADYGIKAAVEQGLFEGPRLFIAGQPLSQTGGHGERRLRTRIRQLLRLLFGSELDRPHRRRRARGGEGNARRTAQGRRPYQDHGLWRRRVAGRSAGKPAIPHRRDRSRGG